MSTLQTTAQRVPTKLVALAIAIALAASAPTIALVAPGGPASSAPGHAVSAAPQRLYMGGPGEGRGTRSEPTSSANDGSQHPGRRP